uniref:Uncharacterized protein n=1 Tax=Candidatus Kentrum eta TaxID=2126337 RepID=A0A450UW38_9GAMM|nr:MAG: hypothetical protein BECKH772A_GA0070896_101097 [Candidatus Kentron sp. H]VFJ97360.1 MAG: hypothetical protein BECKH772B_GA0070898_101109 [Candidatus Kentron sp. H]VFK02683.1 MAG: hypothetical protein BECKH772C_GA0070978_100999 [Candidatus Kentron sp. H]
MVGAIHVEVVLFSNLLEVGDAVGKFHGGVWRFVNASVLRAVAFFDDIFVRIGGLLSVVEGGIQGVEHSGFIRERRCRVRRRSTSAMVQEKPRSWSCVTWSPG